MLDQGLFKKHFVGQEGFQWWIGQIADEEVWKSNIPSMPQASNDGIQGFGERYLFCFLLFFCCFLLFFVVFVCFL